MAATFSSGAKDPALNTFPATFPAGSALELWAVSSAPAVGAAVTGTLLCTITLPTGPWTNSANGSGVQKAGTWAGTGAAAAGGGTQANFFRLRQAADTNAASTTAPRIQGSVTLPVGVGGVTAGTVGDLTLDNTSIAQGQGVTVNTYTIS